MLILPGDPLFYETLTLAKRPDWKDVAAKDQGIAFCAMPGEAGLLTPLSWEETQEYLDGGAWEERMIEEGFTEEDLDQL